MIILHSLRYPCNWQINWECVLRKLRWTKNLLLSLSAKLLNVSYVMFWPHISIHTNVFECPEYITFLSVTETLCAWLSMFFCKLFPRGMIYYSYCLYLVTPFASSSPLSVHILTCISSMVRFDFHLVQFFFACMPSLGMLINTS